MAAGREEEEVVYEVGTAVERAPDKEEVKVGFQVRREAGRREGGECWR